MIGAWLIFAAWTGWIAQVGLGDWLLVREGGRLRWLRAAPSYKALLGLSDRWTVGRQIWLRYAHERVALGMTSRKGRTIELPLQGRQPILVTPHVILEERWQFSASKRRIRTAR